MTAQRGARAAERGDSRTVSTNTSAGDGGVSRQSSGVLAGNDAVLVAMSEREFQSHVRKALTTLGWEVYVFPVMKMTRPGWPDLAAANARVPGRLLMWELKTQRGRVRPEQKALLATLAKVPGVDARVVRPRDWPMLRDALIVEPLAAAAGEGE